MDQKDSKEVETDVRAGTRIYGGYGDSEIGGQGKPKPRLCWEGGMQSSLETLAFQSLGQDFVNVIQPELAGQINCSNLHIVAGSYYVFRL